LKVAEVIIIDSSDLFFAIEDSPDWGFRFQHRHVSIKSAAVQRNIGMDLISRECDFLCFLDDDVRPDPDYVSTLISGLNKTGAVGVSGIALNPLKNESLRRKPRGLFGNLQRIFGLDSNLDGKLLGSGVNIPVRIYSGDIQEVEWLIGCSIWRYKKVYDLRFEADFAGQSLSEDVIFSIRANERGQLFVDPNVHLSHTESEVGRPRGADFWSMWVENRKRVVDVSSKGKSNYVRFHFANFGQFISLIYSGILVKKTLSFDFIGIPLGYMRLIMRGVRK
jgi:GT2 family glycosyltransferase